MEALSPGAAEVIIQREVRRNRIQAMAALEVIDYGPDDLKVPSETDEQLNS